MNYKYLFLLLAISTLVGSCLPWDLPDECREQVPTSVSTVIEANQVSATIGGFNATWSLENSAGLTIISNFGSNFSFNLSTLQNGSYVIRATGKNNCGFKFEQREVFQKVLPIEMVSIPGGTFQMGDTKGEGEAGEIPVRSVAVSSFRMGKHEVTQAQWQAVMGNNPSGFQNCPNCPVERVSWFDAVAFCNALSIREGRQVVYTINGTNVTANWSANGYRLPTEAEWEYAAGGGSTNRTRFGNGKDILDVSESNFNASASFKMPYSNTGISKLKTVEVGSYIPNKLGLYDMSGNVWEWCWDWWGAYPNRSETNPIGISSGQNRIFRGGSWDYSPFYLRTSYRHGYPPTYVYFTFGFRVVTQN